MNIACTNSKFLLLVYDTSMRIGVLHTHYVQIYVRNILTLVILVGLY